MKPLFFSFITFLTLIFNAVSQDNVASPNNTSTIEVTATNTTPATLQATLNDVVIDILRGAKSASSEVYQASKAAVVASVDFAKKQVPDVVEQFLNWKLSERLIYIVGWAGVAGLIFYISKSISSHLKKYEENMFPVDAKIAFSIKWITRIISISIIILSIWINGMVIAKITIAPKVYLIEYVVDTINANRPNN
jgi:hypothetical protein